MQKAKTKRQSSGSGFLPFAFWFLPFALTAAAPSKSCRIVRELWLEETNRERKRPDAEHPPATRLGATPCAASSPRPSAHTATERSRRIRPLALPVRGRGAGRARRRGR